jgi:RND superfamily putative drug exporter
MLGEVAELPHVAEVASPYDPGVTGQFSQDGLTAFAKVSTLTSQTPVEDLQAIVDTARAADGGPLQVELTGSPIGRLETPAGLGEVVGFAAAAVILYVAFGSVLATLLPLISAVVALGVGLSMTGALSHVIDVAEFGPSLAALIGLGVGVDYALFIVSRYRAELRAGANPQEAAVAATRISGRAIVFAGVIVCVCLLGLLALRISLLNGAAVACAMVVASTMATAVTLLPAMLGFFGMKVLGRKERAALAARAPEAGVPHPKVPDTPDTEVPDTEVPTPGRQSGLWWRWARWVEKHPLQLSAAAALLLITFSVPIFSMRLGTADQGNGPESNTSRRGYDLLAEGFGAGFNGPLTLAAEIGSPTDLDAFDSLVTGVRDTPGVASVTEPRMSPNGRAAVATVFPRSGPQDVETSELLERLRDDVIPAAAGSGSLVVHVGGVTAFYDDLGDLLAGKLPQFIGIVVGFAFLLLVVVFRSLLVPALASVMNLLAVAATFGVVVAIFQRGWLSGILGIEAGPIDPLPPVMMVAILFGLSMDYQVFLVSRMHEEWLARRDNRVAVTVGLAETGHVVTAAGAIMTLVFASFALQDDRAFQLFGLGLALAVVIDAFAVRTALVPALMHVFGHANWWLPHRLDRVIPRVSIEPAVAAPHVSATEHAGSVPAPTYTRRIRHLAAHRRRARGRHRRPGAATNIMILLKLGMK